MCIYIHMMLEIILLVKFIVQLEVEIKELDCLFNSH